MSRSMAMSIMEPTLDMPSPYIMSTSTCLNGGATLFLTIFTRVRLPMGVPSEPFSVSILRTSILTEA